MKDFKKAIKKSGLKKIKVAADLEITNYTLSRILNGKQPNISGKLMARINAYCDTLRQK